MGSGPRRRAVGLYVHLPFCAIRCAYCTFVTSTDLDACAALAPAFGPALADFFALGLARRCGERVRCTPRGGLVSNELLATLW